MERRSSLHDIATETSVKPADLGKRKWTYISVLILGPYVVLLSLRTFSAQWTVIFGIANTIVQLSLDCVCLGVLAKTPSIASVPRRAWQCLRAAMVFMLLGDAIFGYWINIRGTTTMAGTALEIWVSTPYLIFWGFSLVAVYDLVPGLFVRVIGGILSCLSLVALAWIFFKFGRFDYFQSYVIHGVAYSAEAIVLGFGFAGLIFSPSPGRRLLFTGFLFITAYSVVLMIPLMQDGLIAAPPIEVIWTTGLALMFLGYWELSKGRDTTSNASLDPQSLLTRLILLNLSFCIAVVGSWSAIRLILPLPGILPKVAPLAGWLIVVVACVVLLSSYLKTFFVRPLERVVSNLKKGGLPPEQTALIKTTEFVELEKEILYIFDQLKTEKDRAENLSHLALQASHDIRSPLSALKVLSSALYDIPDDQKKLLEQVTTRINDIAEELLSRRKKLVDRTDRVGDIVRSLIEEKIAPLKSHKPHLTYQAPGELESTCLSMDSTTFGRMVSNCINNSIEAGASLISLNLTRAEQPNSVIFSIVDNASGLSEEALKRLRAGESFTSKAKGHGMGLVHLREVVTSSGGSFEIESELNRGTKIKLTLATRNLDT